MLWVEAVPSSNLLLHCPVKLQAAPEVGVVETLKHAETLFRHSVKQSHLLSGARAFVDLIRVPFGLQQLPMWLTAWAIWKVFDVIRLGIKLPPHASMGDPFEWLPFL